MWAYKFLNKDSRLYVPTLKTFLKQNHDLLKLWFEEEHEPPDERINFWIRMLRFITYLLLAVVMEYALIDPQDKYYHDTCFLR